MFWAEIEHHLETKCEISQKSPCDHSSLLTMIYAKCGKKSKIINEHAIKHDYAMNNKLAVYGDISVYLCDFFANTKLNSIH